MFWGRGQGMTDWRGTERVRGFREDDGQWQERVRRRVFDGIAAAQAAAQGAAMPHHARPRGLMHAITGLTAYTIFLVVFTALA
jgi:hypothetical protein